jgi:hypothetical protein
LETPATALALRGVVNRPVKIIARPSASDMKVEVMAALNNGAEREPQRSFLTVGTATPALRAGEDQGALLADPKFSRNQPACCEVNEGPLFTVKAMVQSSLKTPGGERS